MNNLPLEPKHYEDLKKSGLTDETIKQAGIESISNCEIKRLLGYVPDGIESAYKFIFGDGHVRLRVFWKEGQEFNNDGSLKPKYLVPKGSSNRLYLPSKVRPVLGDVSIPLNITEGEKKSLKGCQEGLFCIAVSGLWNWKIKDEKKLISDFDKIAFKGRTVVLNPDNDWLEPDRTGGRKNLKAAVYDLAELLIDEGARVYWREIS
ncbi:MAG: DUF3854 domain-containing protein [Planctomycetes bacterium]|nr:DUF3854 domain-containing protein [Planctomycetota bacterium]